MRLHWVNNIAYFCRRQIHSIILLYLYNIIHSSPLDGIYQYYRVGVYHSNADEKSGTKKENNRVGQQLFILLSIIQFVITFHCLDLILQIIHNFRVNQKYNFDTQYHCHAERFWTLQVEENEMQMALRNTQGIG